MFSMHYYFCRRGTENFQEFTKDTFQLMFDNESGITYVRKVTDELSKNHQETDQEIITGFMPQLMEGTGHPHKLCPVRSFENYVNHLSPKIPNLWQHPLKKPSTEVWYAAIPQGHNPVEKFMSNLSSQ